MQCDTAGVRGHPTERVLTTATKKKANNHSGARPELLSWVVMFTPWGRNLKC